MSLEKVLSDLARTHLQKSNDWYQWRNINPTKLPLGIKLIEGNQYEQNVQLKLDLNQQFQEANEETRYRLTHYYIAIWGGIKTNRKETLWKYAVTSSEELIKLGEQGVASWSKALCIRNPERYAIYDARVATALNALQVLNEIEYPIFYPIGSSRNNAIQLAKPKLRAHAQRFNWCNAGANFYSNYNSLLSNCAAELGTKQYTLEMLLFSRAPYLALRLLNQSVD